MDNILATGRIGSAMKPNQNKSHLDNYTTQPWFTFSEKSVIILHSIYERSDTRDDLYKIYV